jgi:sulfate permease, SulP family
VVVVSGIVAAHGIDGLFMCTMMAGVLLVVLGATSMGSAVKFIPRPVVIGFTNGIAVLIASTQIKEVAPSIATIGPGMRLDNARQRSITATVAAASSVAVGDQVGEEAASAFMRSQNSPGTFARCNPKKSLLRIG